MGKSFIFIERMKEMNNDLSKIRIFVGQDKVYLIEGLELDVEFDYLSPEEHTKAVLELEDYIQSHDIQPVKCADGYVEVNEDMLVYLADYGEIDYATGFEREENPSKDQQTERKLEGFYNECLSFWNKEKEHGTVLGKSPEHLAIQDVSFIKHDPSIPNGELLDENTKQKWLKEKRNQLLDNKSREQIADMEM